jgi:hypothetical protein
MIVSIAARNNDERIFDFVGRICVWSSTKLARRLHNDCAFPATRITPSIKNMAGETFIVAAGIIRSARFIDCVLPLPHLHSRAFIVISASKKMRRLPFSYGPSHLAVVVLVHFVCMTLLVLLSL